MAANPASHHYELPRVTRVAFSEEHQVGGPTPAPGVHLVNYLTDMLHSFFGLDNWNRYGQLSVSLLDPQVMVGDRVTVAGKLMERTVDSSGWRVVVALWIDDETQGRRVAEAEARCQMPS